MVCLSRPHHLKFFKGYLPESLLGPFLNTLTHTFRNTQFSQYVGSLIPNPFHAVGLFLYSQKTSENHRASDAFRWYGKRSVALNGLIAPNTSPDGK